MDVKTACAKFKIEKRQVYQLGKLGLCGIAKVNGKWDIPDDTRVLIPFSDIRRFLFYIWKYKNNKYYPFPRDLCTNMELLEYLISQQYQNGFLDSPAKGNTLEEILSKIKLTDPGINAILGKKETDILSKTSHVELKLVSVDNINVGVVNNTF